jgi:hypothetical protein
VADNVNGASSAPSQATGFASTQEELLARAGLGGIVPGVQGQTAEPTVYMGASYWQTPETGYEVANINNPVMNKKYAYFTLDQAKSVYYTFDDKQIATLVELGSRYMGVDADRLAADGQSIQRVWDAAVTAAAEQSRATGEDVTPWEALSRLAKQSKPYVDPTAYDGPVSTVNLSSPDGARQILTKTLQSELGRAPNDQEMQSFFKALTAYQQDNPQVRTVNETGSEVVYQDGANSQQFAEDYANSLEGAAEYDAATTFKDTLLNAIKAPNLGF